MDYRTQMIINESIIRLSEGCILAEQLKVLEGVLDNNSEAIEYFIDCSGDLSLCEELLQRTIVDAQPQVVAEPSCLGAEVRDAHLWNALLYQEQTAPAIQEEPHEEPKRDFVQKVERVKLFRTFNKRAFYSFVASAAAILLVVLFVQLIPPKSSPFEVATFADAINAKWANNADIMKEGLRLSTGAGPLLLKEGLVELLFDNNAKVTIEGPAEFEIISEDRVKLRYGRLYSVVPREALGFSVATPNAMIIDLGTQFGAFVDFQGNTELHVTEGKTTLVAGEKKEKTSMEVGEGSAKKIFGISSDISDISCNDTLFVRSINSKTNLIWRGQPKIDMADVVGGGNGLGTGQLEKGIHPVTGKLEGTTAEDRLGSGRYIAVPENRYVDGVFVPNGRTAPVVVSSKGHVFADCPATNNVFYMEIINSKTSDSAIPVLWKEMTAGSGIYGTSTCPSIFMHANLGITFDLDAVRADFAGAEITRFAAEAGLSPMATREGNVDVWILVDGHVRYCQKGITEKGKVYPVEINLDKSDRFLTLVTTDGGDVDYLEETKRATDSDWALFARPRLELSAGSDK